MKRIIKTGLFWMLFTGLLLLSTIIWFFYAISPMLESKKEIQATIASLTEILENTKNNSTLPSNIVLEKKDILDWDRISAIIQQAADAHDHDIILLDFTQTNVSTSTTLTNIQSQQLNQKNLEAVMYSIKVQGNYQQLLGFLITLSKEQGVFLQSANYAVGDYPEATLTLIIKTYRLS